MPGTPDALTGLSNVLGSDEGLTLEDRVNAINALLKGLMSGATAFASEAWHVVGSGGSEPAFTTGWSAGIDAPCFYKHLGRVYLRGTITRTSAATTTAFILPAGYRPGAFHFQPAVVTNSSTIVVAVVTSGGLVNPWSPVTDLRLDGISFRAEA